MDALRWKRIGELFDAARDLDSEHQVEFLYEQCGDDESLREQVVSLLDADNQRGPLDSRPTISALPAPDVVAGRFRIVRYVAEGGMGTVYEAEDMQLHERVALKTIRPEIASEPNAVERFKQEIRLGKRVTHPNVCRIHDLGTYRSKDGRDVLFLTMQFLSGETLASRIKRGPLSKTEAAPLIEDLAEALSAAHQAEVIHRDFKSGNVMLVRGIQRTCAVVTDFGLARGIHQSAPVTSAIVGTIDYMAPEQIRGSEITPAADIYSLGVVMYEMVTGQLPFTGDSKVSVALKHLNDEPQSPRVLLPNLDSTWEEVILACLRKVPQERPSIAELKAAVTQGRTHPTSKSIALAVLPFKNPSSDPDGTYFVEGLAEDLINRLAKLKGVTVLARTSAFRLTTEEQDVRRLKARLGIRFVLSLSVRHSGKRLRVVAELVDTQDEFQVWSEIYDRVLEDLFEIQNEIVLAISREIGSRLSLLIQPPDIAQSSHDLNAYTSFLKARFLENKRTPKDIQRAECLFEESLQLDASLTPAWAGKAECHLLLGIYGAQAPVACFPQAEDAASHALRLDPQSAKARAVLGSVAALFRWDWPGAEEEFHRAAELDAHDGTACQWYANHCLIPQGRFAEAWEQIRRARKNDPLSLATMASVAFLHMLERDYDQAAAECHAALELDSHFSIAHYFLGQVLGFSGKAADGIRELKLAVSLSGQSSETIAVLGRMFADVGNGRAALRLLDQLQRRARREYVSPLLLAQILVGLSEFDAALEQLEFGLKVRAADLIWIGVHPFLAPLRAELRFKDILRAIHLAQEEQNHRPDEAFQTM